MGLFCLESSQHTAHDGNTVHQDFSRSGTADHSASTPLTLHLYPWQGASWPGTDSDVASDSVLTISERLHLDLNTYITVNLHSDLPLWSWMPVLNCEIPDNEGLFDVAGSVSEGCDQVQVLQNIERKGELASLVTQLIDVLQKAVMKRVHNLPRPHHLGDAGECSMSLHGCSASSSTCDAFSFMSLKKQHCEDFQESASAGTLELFPASDYDVSGITNLSVTVPASEQSDQLNCVLEESVKNLPSDQTNSLVSTSGFKTNAFPSVPQRDGTERSGSEFSAAEADVAGDLSEGVNHLEHPMQPAHVAVLFSGGVDSTVLAALADRCVERFVLCFLSAKPGLLFNIITS